MHKGGVSDRFNDAVIIPCVMDSCFAGYIMTRGAHREAEEFAIGAIRGDACSGGCAGAGVSKNETGFFVMVACGAFTTDML